MSQIIPLEAEISKAATKQFPQFQHQFAPLAEKLAGLGLPGEDRLRDLNQELANVLLTDASDAPQRLGGEESVLFDSLKWASEVKRALENGLEQTVRQLQQHRRDIEALPDSGMPGQLKADLAEELTLFRNVSLQLIFTSVQRISVHLLTSLQSRIRDTTLEMEEAQQQRLQEAAQDLTRLSEWSELTQEEQQQRSRQPGRAGTNRFPRFAGIESADQPGICQAFSRQRIQRPHCPPGAGARRQRLEEEKAKAKQAGQTKLTRTINIPTAITEASQVDTLIQELQALKHELALYSEIEVHILIQD